MQSFIEKYNPPTLNDFILDASIRDILKGYVAQKCIPNILFAGRQGIGKSCLAHLLVKEIDADLLYVNASIENGVDVIRTKILEFTRLMSSVGKIKVIILDEADGLTSSTNGASAQDALRNIIDTSLSDTRFILTANYDQRISAPLKSRCPPIHITFPKKDVIELIVKIIKAEKIVTNIDDFKSFCAQVVDEHFPDIRSILNILELSTRNNHILRVSNIFVNTDMEALATELYNELTELLDRKNMRDIRQLYISQGNKIKEDWAILAGFIYDKFAKFEYDERTGKILLIIADGIYRIETVQVNKEIQFAAMLQRILQI